MRKTMRKVISVLLVLTLVFSVLPTATIAAALATPTTVSINLTAQKDGAFLFAPKTGFSVSSDTAENYGFSDKVPNGVSLMDVLVAAHVAYYGDAFTKENASSYIVVNTNGEPVTTFGVGTTAYSADYTVNGVIPNNGDYECGQNIDFTHLKDTKMKDNDSVEFFVFQDTKSRKDNYAWLNKNGASVDVLTLEPSEEVTLQVKGIHFLSEATGFSSADQMRAAGTAIGGVKVGIYDAAKNTVTEKWTADASGNVTVSFDKAGTYYIAPYGSDANGVPTILGLTKVEVRPISLYPTPSALSVTAEGNIVDYTSPYSGSMNHYALITPDSNTIQFSAVDQDGKETPVIWSSNNKAITFASTTSGTATMAASSNSSTGVKVTATSRLDESITATYYVYVTPLLHVNKKEITVTLDRDGKIPTYPPSLTAYPSEYADFGRLVWTVADPEILTLSGKESNNYRSLLGGKPGTTTVTISDRENPNYSDTATVTVQGVFVADPNGDCVRTTTYVGQTLQLTAYAANPESKIVWQSSNKAVATVDENGLVTGVAQGVAVIHAADENEDIGGITVAVGKSTTSVYLDDLLLSSASSYYNEDSYKTYLNSVSYNYNGSYAGSGHVFDGYELVDNTYYVKATDSAFQMKLRPFFDADNVTVEYYLNGEKLGNGTVNLEYPITLPAGTSKVTVRAISKADAANYTDYSFTIVKARSTTATVGATAFQPVNRGLKSELLLNGFGEGTAFQLDQDGNVIIPASTYSKPWSTGKYSYKAYLYGDVDSFRTTFTASDSNAGRLAYSVDGSEFVEGIGTLTTDPIRFPESGKVTITVKSVSDSVYFDCTEAGTDPWSDESVRTYTVVVERLDLALTSDMVLTDLTFDDACIEVTPGFSPNRLTAGALTPSNHDQTTMIVTVPSGVKINVPTSTYGTQATTTDNGDGTYTIVVNTPMASYGNDKEVKIELTKTTEDGNTLKVTYVVTLYKIGKKLSYSDPTAVTQYGLPDSVTDYLCIGSQSTNNLWNSAYDQIGISPERTLTGTGGWALQIALGSFGGYVTYYFKDGITNDASHPYGIDFNVYSRPYDEASSKRPGTVWVSEDGVAWYELAGSEHYDDTAIWNYQVTYQKNALGNIDFTDNLGRSGSFATGEDAYQYPMEEYYPLHNWTEAEKNGTMTMSGTLLLGENGLDFSVADVNAANPAWGYASVGTPGNLSVDESGNYTVPAVNPYSADGKLLGGDAFDLAWAVDANGNPVELNEVHYVKVQGASMIQATTHKAEKSTRVSSVAKAYDADTTVGVTSAPSAIRINEEEIQLQDNVYTYTVAAGKEFTVDVAAAEGDNVYINNACATSRTYDALHAFDFDKGIVRIVVQNGEAAPVIYYITVLDNTGIKAAEAAIDAIGTVTLDSAEAIEAARTAFDALSAAEQGLVKNADVLTAAEAAYKALVDAREADKAAAKAASERIDAIGTVTESSKPAIDSARNAYDALTEAQKALVGNYDVLTAAEAEYAELTTVIPFVDVSRTAWYYDAVRYATYRQLFSGVSDTQFAPDGTMTRAMLVAVLYRYAGFPDVGDVSAPFTDLAAAWYKDAVAWGAANDIVYGIGNGLFAPDAPVTREQIAAILYRYAQKYDMNTEKSSELAAFPDADQASSWAVEALQWAVGSELIVGSVRNGIIVLNPGASATRAEAAQILMGFAKNCK